MRQFLYLYLFPLSLWTKGKHYAHGKNGTCHGTVLSLFFSEFLFKISSEFTNIGHCITVPDIIHTDILLKSRLVEVFSFLVQSELKLLNWHRGGWRAGSVLVRRLGALP